MALDSAARWKLIRDITVEKKTGTLVLQAGPRYLSWWIEEGNLICVSSTFEESTFTQLVYEKKLTEAANFSGLQNRIDEGHALGWLLLHQKILKEEEFCALLMDHWTSCAEALFDPGAHVFWSGTLPVIKHEFIRTDRPFGEVLILADRNRMAVTSALRIVQQMKEPFRICGENPETGAWSEQERRIWMYLQSGNSLKQMLQDAEIAHIPCYKFLFLLWLCGYISEARPAPKREVVPVKISVGLLEKIPAEWVFPLCAGALIGVILAPSTEPKPTPAHEYRKIEPVEEPTAAPAWSPTKNEDINTEARRREDNE
jgi:hypothetical protein